MLHINKDQRILDFCGENIKPGYWVTINEDANQNHIKFEFTLKGSSGNLGTSIIGDYLTHNELTLCELERQDFFQQKKQFKDKISKLESE